MAIQATQQQVGPSRGHMAGGRDAQQRDQRRQNGHIVDIDEERLATGLGWFSIGLGLAGVAAPGGMAQLIGISDDDRSRRVLRAVGVREIASGLGILSRPRPVGWVWSRVGGDAMDLALLGKALTSDRSNKNRVTAATAAVLGVTILDVLCGQRLGERSKAAPTDSSPLGSRAIDVTKVITVGRPADAVYKFWRDLQNLPRFMRHLESVETTGDRRSHWKARAPFGRKVEWDAEITEDRPHQRLAWRSLEGADVPNAGSVSFERAPGGRGTVVRVELRYDPPGGVIGATIAKLFGHEPGQQVQEDLRAFKQVMETGEVVQSDATIKGGGPAQPPADRPGS